MMRRIGERAMYSVQDQDPGVLGHGSCSRSGMAVPIHAPEREERHIIPFLLDGDSQRICALPDGVAVARRPRRLAGSPHQLIRTGVSRVPLAWIPVDVTCSWPLAATLTQYSVGARMFAR